MKPTREESLFALALEKSAMERAAFLDRECQGDSRLRARLDALLKAHENPDSLLALQSQITRTTVGLNISEEFFDDSIGQTIGRYKLLEKVGEGGCGVVYVAEQTEPVRRRVALKVIKLGMDTKAVVARFEAERQALAMMDHPNIAKVLDAGTTDKGRPYFVMELVRGIRITDYCDQNQLATRERLELFIRVCHAIQHAHQKGIIHRDIKPSNILVTLHDGVPVPKVIDFGIAKATEGRLTDATVYTQLHQFIGTPAYMSPEQAEMSGLDVDTRSDIYSLGVLLYELLTGKTPFDGQELLASGIDGMRKTIREREPIRPSTRLAAMEGEDLTTAAKRRSLEAPKLVHLLQGDLDWIVMKALEKDRTRRYETANGLGADIQRHLSNEPVVARPPSAAYKLQKAIRRNKLAFGAAAVVALALIIGTGIAAAGWLQAKKERDDANKARTAEEQQRLQAQANEVKARAAEAEQKQLRLRAEEQELRMRRQAYAADMNLVQQALANNNIGRARQLLNRHRPAPGEMDLRGWEWRYLWQQSRLDAHEVFSRETNRFCTMSLDASGSLMAANTWSGRLSVHDVRSQKSILEQTGSRTSAFGERNPILAYSQSAVGFAERNPVLSYSQTVPLRDEMVIWDCSERRELRRIPLTGPAFWCLFASDDRKLLVLSILLKDSQAGFMQERSHVLSAWDVANGTLLWQQPVNGPQTPYVGRPFAVSPDGTSVALAALGGYLRVYNTMDGTERWSVIATDELVTSLAFSPDGSTLLTGAGFTDSKIRIWEARTGKAAGAIEGHRSWVTDLLFLPEKNQLVSSSGDQTIRIWEWPSRQLFTILYGHQSEVDGLAFLKGRQVLASRGKEGTILFWDLRRTVERRAFQKLPVRVNNAVFADDGSSVLISETGGGLALWDTTRLAEIQRWRRAAENDQARLRLARDGKQVALIEADRSLSVWNLSNGARTSNLLASNETVLDGCFSANGRYFIAVVRQLQSIYAKVWDSQSWRLTAPARYGVDQTESLLKPPSFPNSVVSGNSRKVRLWDLSQPAVPPREYSLGRKELYGFETSPDSRLGAAALGEGYVQIWDLATGEPLRQLKSFLLGVHSVAFSKDGNRLAAGSNGLEAIKLWETSTWQELVTLPGQGSLFFDVSFSADERSIMARSRTGDLHFWSAPTWEEINRAEPSTE